MKATICSILACWLAVARSQDAVNVAAIPHVQDPAGEGCLVLFDLVNPKDKDWGTQFGLECVADVGLLRRCRVPVGSSFLVDTDLCALGSTLAAVDVAAGTAGEFPTTVVRGDMPEEGVEFSCTETGIEASFLGQSLNKVEYVDCFNYPESVPVASLNLEALGYTADLFNPKDLGFCLVLADMQEPQDLDFGSFFNLDCNPNMASAPVCRIPLGAVIKVTRDFCSATFWAFDVAVETVDGVSARSVGNVSGPVPVEGLDLTCTETGLVTNFPAGYPKERVELVQCGNYPEEPEPIIMS